MECLLPPSVNTSAIIQADRIVRDLQFTVLDRPGSSAFDGVSSTFTFHLHIREIKMAANGSLPGGENQFTAAVNIGVGLFIQVSEWTIEWQWLDETIVIESISPPASLFTQQQTVVKLSGQNLPSSADNAAIIQGRFKYGLQQPQGVRLSINGQPAQPILAENIVID
jgi:hypothetical protein